MIQKEVPVNTKADTKLKVNALFITWQRSHIAVNKEAALFGCFSDVGGWTKNVPGWLGSIFPWMQNISYKIFSNVKRHLEQVFIEDI